MTGPGVGEGATRDRAEGGRPGPSREGGLTSRRVVLIQPPLALPLTSGLSTPSLVAFLKAHGHPDVVQRDLNLEAYRHFLSAEVVGEAVERVTPRVTALRGTADDTTRALLARAEALLAAAPEVLERLDEARHTLSVDAACQSWLGEVIEDPAADTGTAAGRPRRDPAADTGTAAGDLSREGRGRGTREPRPAALTTHDAVVVVERAAALVGMAWFPSRLSVTQPPLFRMRFHFSDSGELAQAVAAADENPFISYFQERVIPELTVEEPLWVGISIMHPFQVIPGLTLARLLKERGVVVCVGGEMFSKELEIVSALFAFTDYFIVREGEHAALELTRLLSQASGEGAADGPDAVAGTGSLGAMAGVDAAARVGRLTEVPNLVYLDDQGTLRRGPRCYEELDRLPTPDFTGLPLELGFPGLMAAPPMLPLSNAKGCYWNRCAFCDIAWSHSHRPHEDCLRHRDPELLVDDMRTLQARHGVRAFYLTGESPTPDSLKRLARAVARHGLDVEWMAYARFERQLTAGVCQELRVGGCCLLQLGLESGCQRVLDLMNKGIELDTVREVLRNLFDAGIRYNVFLMVGAPTETREEAEETLRFVLDHQELFDTPLCTFQIGTMMFPRHSLMFEDPAAYGITEVTTTGRDLRARHDARFVSEGGMTRQEAAAVCRTFHERIAARFTWVGGQWAARVRR